MVFDGIKRLENLDKRLEKLEEEWYNDVPTTAGFDITQIIDKPVTILHNTFSWAADGIIVEEYGNYTFVNRAREKELLCRPLMYGMLLKPFCEGTKRLYLLFTPRGGGGYIVDSQHEKFSKFDKKLRDSDL